MRLSREKKQGRKEGGIPITKGDGKRRVNSTDVDTTTHRCKLMTVKGLVTCQSVSQSVTWVVVVLVTPKVSKDEGQSLIIAQHRGTKKKKREKGRSIHPHLGMPNTSITCPR
mmetsp:Transcript_47609/g.70872  ORF Transcript_47609/g.70872 Transcript_47609/m.70872 type:complete len:112 (-) Transcript_47609:1301-1636(-)